MASSSTSPDPEDGHDYTEGASAVDIQQALANSYRERRNSQYGQDVDAMFDGPGHSVNPSSVSRMSLHDHARRNSNFSRTSRSRRRSEDSMSRDGRTRSRRMSTDSAVGGADVADGDWSEGISDDEAQNRGRHSRGRKKSQSPPATRSNVFENIASIFGRSAPVTDSPPRSRRPSLSSRASRSRLLRRHSSRRSDVSSDYAITTDDEDGEERWGYTSNEEDSEEEADIASVAQSGSEIDYGSLPPSPGPGLPLLVGDPIFGSEARIEMGELELLSPPPPGPPSRQTLYIADEDAHIRMVGYEPIRWRQWLWFTCCVLSFGILGLLGRWFPRLWLRWVTRERAFIDMHHGFVVVETAYRDIALFPICRKEYPYPLNTVVSTAPEPSQLLPSARGTRRENEDVGTLTYVDYRYNRFALDPRTGLFSMIRDWRDSSWSGLGSVQNGLRKEVQAQRMSLFGPNLIDIEGKSTLSLLIDEIIHPFYVFQIASIILWSLDDYYYYAFCIALISAISIMTTLVETKQTIKRMREMSRFVCKVRVYRDSTWIECDSSELVPGDIVDLIEPPLATLPADMFLLSGDAIVNESMLTGESVPVSKIPIKGDDLAKWKNCTDAVGDMAKSFLYAGTRVVRVRGASTLDESAGAPALGLVVRTGFYTTKGALVRSMLFPKPTGFKFYRDSMRFIGVLAGVAGLGFCASAVQFVRLGVRWHTILLRALDLITVVVPPALPATLSIGTSFAIGRLRKLGIFCISPSRVNVAGQINVCCFDKTGTLTEDGLDILGVRAPERNTARFGELIEDVHDLPAPAPAPAGAGKAKANFLHALATCHSLKKVDGEVIGDPLDVKMFEFTKWTLEEGHVAGAGVVKNKAVGDRPAALVQTVVRPPGSARFRIEDALKGAGKHAHFLELGVIRTFEFVSALRRMSVIVKRLKSSSMEIYVKGAPEVMAEICDKSTFPSDYDDLLSYYTKRGYRVIAMAGKSIEGLTWLRAQKMKREQAESSLHFLGLVIFENKLKPGTTPAIQTLRAAHFACRMITGDNPLTAVSVARECGLINPAAQVFAPAFVVERLQALGYTVLMCGDGANDCAALKAADVGLSLSEAEASVAAPFTSRTPDISCVLEVIKEGRAALVTSFSCFKYMALYSLIQFTTITLLYSFASSLGDFQFLYIDLFIIIPIAVTMGRTLPYPRIHPKRPTASLVSKKVLASLVGQIVITSAIQFWAFFWVRSQEWYIPPVQKDPSSDDGKLEATNYENSALFLVSCFQYILVAAVFSIGPPYRKQMWTNGWFMVSMVCLSVFNLVVLLSPPGAIARILELMALPLPARGTLLLAVVMNVAASMAFEQWGTQVVARVIGLFFELRRQQRVRDGKLYKAVEGGMR
ncbi:Ca-transporting ATPase [Trametes sanguinea]|nr:Ca-transporting ATPase [Trametes sanguinea]